MDVQVLDNQLETINDSYIQTECRLEDLPEVMDDTDKWREREGNSC